MTDETSAPGVDSAIAPADITPAANLQESMSAESAADYLIALRKPKPEAESAEKPATATPKLADEASPEPAEEQPIGDEAPEEAEPAELPPIEPPRSWTKEAKDRWEALPREAQEEVARIEQSREKEFRRSQNEAADQRKAIEAERIQAEQTRKEYEAKLPAIMQALQDAQNSQFPDIKTMADVERMALEDPFRKIQWDTHQQKLQVVAYQQEQANQRQEQERTSNWSKFQTEETAKAAELHPELADPVKAKQLQEKVVELFRDKGFTDSDLNSMATGEKYSPFDHRWQSILVDALKYREAQKAKPVAVAKSVPPVQRPGVAPPRGAAKAGDIQALSQKLDRTGSVDDALAVLAARRKAS